VVSEVLSDKRELSKAHIRALRKRFNVSLKCSSVDGLGLVLIGHAERLHSKNLPLVIG
jgi:hypothetical protein